MFDFAIIDKVCKNVKSIFVRVVEWNMDCKNFVGDCFLTGFFLSLDLKSAIFFFRYINL